MNKKVTKNIFKFLLLISIILFSGCGESNFNHSQNSTLTSTQSLKKTISTQTSTEIVEIINPTQIPCPTIEPPSLDSDIEQLAEEWFLSKNSEFLPRSDYNTNSLPVLRWKWFCEDYQVAIINNDYWITDPILFTMRLAGYPNLDNLPPDSVKAFFIKTNSNILTVVIFDENLMDDAILAVETRIDVIKEKSWEIKWIGSRWQCRRTGNTDWTINLCP